jgi:hypothetical protein
MTITKPGVKASVPRKAIRVPRDVIEGAKLQVSLDRRRGRTTSAIIRKIAEAKPAH